MFAVDLPPSSSERRCQDDAMEPSSCLSTTSSDLLKFAYRRARTITGSSLYSVTGTSVSSSCSETRGCSESLDSDRSTQASLEGISEEEQEDTFFDCVSHATLLLPATASSSSPNSDNEMAIFRNRMCIYADGRPAYVPAGNCIANIPLDYLEYCDNDHRQAQIMWKASQQWRQEQQIHTILQRPNKLFHHVKRYYPSCFHGIDKQGLVLEYMFPGQMNPKALIPNARITDELLDHHHFMQEYISNCLYSDKQSWDLLGLPTKPIEGTCDRLGLTIIVIDVNDAGIDLLNADVFNFLKRIVYSSTQHYPAMVDSCMIINAPFWVAGVFATIKPILPDTLPVEIVSKVNTLAKLREYVNDDQIPIEYGGSSAYPLHHHPLEVRLHEVAKEAETCYNNDETQMNKHDLMERCSTSLSSSSSSSSSFADGCGNRIPFSQNSRNIVDKGGSDVRERFLCCSVPLSNTCQYRRPTFVLDEDFDSDLVLTPRELETNWLYVVQEFLSGLTRGFVGCGH